MKPRILLVGKNGQVGAELATFLPQIGDVAAYGHEQLDLTLPEQIRQRVREIQPNLIVNAAAFTNVDQAEKDQQAAYSINATAPRILAEEAKRTGALLVHFSTDYVFDGASERPYNENDKTNPINLYDETKLAGEKAIQEIGPSHLIFRTAWVYATAGRNFLLTILRLASEREELKIVRDQIGAPTWSQEIARATTSVLGTIVRETEVPRPEAGGIYHMTAEGEASWYEFALAILEEASRLPPGVPWFDRSTGGRAIVTRRVIPITSEEYPTPARRPLHSVLSNQKLFSTFGVQLPDWRKQLHDAFREKIGDHPLDAQR